MTDVTKIKVELLGKMAKEGELSFATEIENSPGGKSGGGMTDTLRGVNSHALTQTLTP